MAIESPDELHVRELLARRFGIILSRINESDQRSPDYELVHGGERAAVVEVKTLQSTPRTTENGWKVTRIDEYRFNYERTDNSPPRVAAIIHTAAKQLSRHAVPKILVILNHESFADVLDLEEAVRGYQDYGSDTGSVLRNRLTSHREAHKRIREDRWLIDLYVWIEPPKGPRVELPTGEAPRMLPAENEATILLRVTSEAGREVAGRFFHCDLEPMPVE